MKLQLDLHKRRKIPFVEKEIARFLVNRYQKSLAHRNPCERLFISQEHAGDYIFRRDESNLWERSSRRASCSGIGIIIGSSIQVLSNYTSACAHYPLQSCLYIYIYICISIYRCSETRRSMTINCWLSFVHGHATVKLQLYVTKPIVSIIREVTHVPV